MHEIAAMHISNRIALNESRLEMKDQQQFRRDVRASLNEGRPTTREFFTTGLGSFSQSFGKSQAEMDLTEASVGSSLNAEQLTVRTTAPEEHLHTHRRLKLKDYLHLNDLERRSNSKHKSRPKATSTTLIISETPARRSPTSSPLQLKSAKLEGGGGKMEEEHIKLIREEIEAKIEVEQKKLEDLKMFLKQDYISHESKTDSFVFLFNVYNKLADMHRINDEVGEAVLDYVKADPHLPSPSLAPKSSEYHWAEEKKELKSPARISSEALSKSIEYAHSLGISKP